MITTNYTLNERNRGITRGERATTDLHYRQPDSTGNSFTVQTKRAAGVLPVIKLDSKKLASLLEK